MARTSTEYLRSTIGRKTLMGITGLGLCLFVLIHMAGNLFLLVSADSFNHYSYKLTSNPLIYVAEIGLLAFFLGHVIIAFVITARNRRAKPIGYAVKPPRDRDATMASKTLILSGILILVFVILHLITFKFGPAYKVTSDGIEMRDLYKLVLEVLTQPIYACWYVFSMMILSLHLSHSLSASVQTLGWMSSRQPLMRKISWAFAIIVCGGFIVEVAAVSLKWVG